MEQTAFVGVFETVAALAETEETVEQVQEEIQYGICIRNLSIEQTGIEDLQL